MKKSRIQGDFIPNAYKNIYEQVKNRLNEKDDKYAKSSNLHRKNLPQFSTEDIKKSTDFEYHKRLRNQKTCLFANRPNSVSVNQTNTLNESVNSFVSGKLDESTFKSILIKNNIDPNIYQIEKEIRATSVGAKNTKNLISNIAKFKNHKIPVKEFTIYDVKKNIEQKRKEEKVSLTSKRVYEYNPNYLSDRNIFSWNFTDDERNTSNIIKQGRELNNTVNVFETCDNPSDIDKYQKRIIKSGKHHEQMSSQIPFGDYGTNGKEKSSNTIDNHRSNDLNPSNVIFRTAIEKTTNLGKRTCNEYKTIFEDLKYKVNYKNKEKSNTINTHSTRNYIKKGDANKTRSIISTKSKDVIGSRK